jgi:ATP-binding cassette, subfamily B (MDR/TAP), member 1
LSGGQRQRLSIARSIISDPKILLCDEATSALDPRAEKLLQDALNRVSASKRNLDIAHKLAKVMGADNIAVMANGKVVEQGNHSEPLERDGLYAAMVRAQDLGAEAREQDFNQEPDEGAYNLKDDSDENLDPIVSLRRTQSEAMPCASEHKAEKLTSGTAGCSLVKCIIVMLKEHPDLYVWYSLIALAYLMVGGTHPAQAILFSRLINVFTLQGPEAKQ